MVYTYLSILQYLCVRKKNGQKKPLPNNNWHIYKEKKSKNHDKTFQFDNNTYSKKNKCKMTDKRVKKTDQSSLDNS